jgi:hypothetical protein
MRDDEAWARSHFFSSSRSGRATAEFSVSSTSSSFTEFGLLGTPDEKGQGRPSAIYLNVHEPFVLACVGVQGAGKSHSFSTVLEDCLVPATIFGQQIVQVKPQAALVLHYDTSAGGVCEATGLFRPSRALDSAMDEPPFIPSSNGTILVSPTYFRQMKRFYAQRCPGVKVMPLLFEWSSFTSMSLKIMMCVTEADNQLYMAKFMDILRKYQKEDKLPSFEAFLKEVGGMGANDSKACGPNELKRGAQMGPLMQRLSLLETVVAESILYTSQAEFKPPNFSEIFGSGRLVIVDLTDPMISPSDANSVFQVVLERFRRLDLGGVGKVIALDEAHKFMDGVKADGLSGAIVDVARLIRHDGTRLLVSTQSPKCLAPELLELVSVLLVHRFHSAEWFTYLGTKCASLDKRLFASIQELEPGEAIVVASRPAPGDSFPMRLRVRPRVTRDLGSSRRNDATAARVGGGEGWELRASQTTPSMGIIVGSVVLPAALAPIAAEPKVLFGTGPFSVGGTTWSLSVVATPSTSGGSLGYSSLGLFLVPDMSCPIPSRNRTVSLRAVNKAGGGREFEKELFFDQEARGKGWPSFFGRHSATGPTKLEFEAFIDVVSIDGPAKKSQLRAPLSGTRLSGTRVSDKPGAGAEGLASSEAPASWGPWTRHVSKRERSVYYFNSQTGVSLSEAPAGSPWV